MVDGAVQAGILVQEPFKAKGEGKEKKMGLSKRWIENIAWLEQVHPWHSLFRDKYQVNTVLK